MRVHPNLVVSRSAKWQFPAAFGLLVLLLIINIFRGPKQAVVTQPPKPVEKKIEVLVAREAIQPGQGLETANIALEQRPVTTLPADALTSFDALKNKVAAGPIPAGYPLATALLADPIAVLPIDNKIEDTPEDPVEALLREIERDTVGVPVTFTSNAPQRGARIAVTLTKPRGESIVVTDDCWVAKSSGREAKLRLDYSKAVILQTARTYGNFNFIEIPAEGESPYAGKAIQSEAELRQFVEADKPTKASSKQPERKIKGYAWVSGEGMRYGIDEDGSIKVVSPPMDSSPPYSGEPPSQ